MKDSAAFRVQMAKLGHPVNGPHSLYTLTPAEIRIYAEGLHREHEAEEDAHAYSGTDGTGATYNRASKRRRDDAALSRMEARLAADDSP